MDENLPKTISDELDAESISDQRNELDAKKFPTLPVEMDSDTYNMNHKFRGMCLIFNNKEFEPHIQLPTRRGTDVDACNLYSCFRYLDFSVTVYQNATTDEILAALKQAACEDHSNNSCFVCVILSHGDNGVIYGRDGKFAAGLIFKPFFGDVCPTLAGKPKLFFIQACQGGSLDLGTRLRRRYNECEMVKLPHQADILVQYSTVAGYFSWRITAKGSWFIQALCHVLKNHGKEKELLEMLTMVNRRSAYDLVSCTPDNPSMHEMKQVPCFTSRLTRKLYFHNAGSTNQRNDEIDAKKFPSSKNSSDPISSTLPVEVDSDTYNMNHKSRGMCLIFNNEEFEPHTQLHTRIGADVDACNLYNLFRDLDFSVTVHHNASKAEILAALQQAACKDHSNNDCFVCVILSHGYDKMMYGCDEGFRTDLIFEQFLDNVCPTLAGKPKLFFIEGGEGDGLDFGTVLRTSHDGNEVVNIPNQADIFVAYSAVAGLFSWRNTTKGSWFIQALCDVLKNHAKEKELLEMLTMVNRQVAYDFVSFTPENPLTHGMKQVPCFTSRLTRKVYFHSK